MHAPYELHEALVEKNDALAQGSLGKALPLQVPGQHHTIFNGQAESLPCAYKLLHDCDSTCDKTCCKCFESAALISHNAAAAAGLSTKIGIVLHINIIALLLLVYKSQPFIAIITLMIVMVTLACT